MERDTQTITTPKCNTKIVIKKWLTGRERKLINEVMFKEMEINMNANEADKLGEKIQQSKFNGKVLGDIQDATIQAYVVSIDGKAENILDGILDLPEEDYNYVNEQIALIANKEEELGEK